MIVDPGVARKCRSGDRRGTVVCDLRSNPVATWSGTNERFARLFELAEMGRKPRARHAYGHLANETLNGGGK